MNDKQIYELVAKTPKISASELATALGVELKAMSDALRCLVDVGDLEKSIRFGDLGRQCQVYELSETFRRSPNGKNLVVGVANEASAPAPKPEVATMPDPTTTVSTQEATTPAPGALLSKVDRAIACITRLGQATDDQLREAMDLLPKTYVGAYLASALKAGRVVRDGALWKLGTGKPQAAPKPAEQLVHDQGSVVRVGNVIAATRDGAPVPAEVKAAITDMAAAAVTELRKPEPAPSAPTAAPSAKPAERAYSCAVWLSGNVEIRKAGGRVHITRAELAEIVAFVADRRAV